MGRSSPKEKSNESQRGTEGPRNQGKEKATAQNCYLRIIWFMSIDIRKLRKLSDSVVRAILLYIYGIQKYIEFPGIELKQI